ncbi:MFS transporter [Ferruginibacter yonginensis]|uniref:MFS transporter n=1 Tax=Ferruginibacter yonginensis TaxID=1310416 RepID=A0ABV8QT96_9BACT
MNVGFFGIQYSFGLQQSAVNPIYDFLGAKPDEIPWLNLAGPLTGLLVQPIIGALSDRTWHPKFGRRKPYFFIGAIMCSIALFLFPFSSSLWMAAGLLWILDAGNNTAMEPYRAFVADKLDETQQATGFQAQSFFTGFGQTLANFSLLLFPLIIVGKTGKLPNWVFASFMFGAVCSIGSVWWSMRTTPEIPPSDEEIKEMRSQPLHLFSPFKDVISAIGNMPKVLWLLALVYLFQWYALFCYWQNSSKAVAQNAFEWHHKDLNATEEAAMKSFTTFKADIKKYVEAKGLEPDDVNKNDTTAMATYDNWKDIITTSLTVDDVNAISEIDANDRKYEKAVSATGGINGWYNIVTFLIAFLLVGFAKKYGAKYVHFICLILAGVGFIAFSQIHQLSLFYVAITGFGIGWASMMGIPYLMVVSEIPKEKYGVYMGIINMMIVIPMFIQTISFGYILKHFLHNDPTKAILFAGVLLLVAALATLLIKSKKLTNEIMAAPATGGH